MSHIFLQKDNISILWDIYEYPVTNYEWEKPVLVRKQKAIILQIVLVVNWKQKIYRVTYDLDDKLELLDYKPFYDLRDFLIEIWYDIESFSMKNSIESTKEDDLPYCD